ncbi:unnamed protein product, partial [marine sediment metagenome]
AREPGIGSNFIDFGTLGALYFSHGRFVFSI